MYMSTSMYAGYEYATASTFWDIDQKDETVVYESVTVKWGQGQHLG